MGIVAGAVGAGGGECHGPGRWLGDEVASAPAPVAHTTPAERAATTAWLILRMAFPPLQ